VLEASVVLNAWTGFLQNRISEQVKILRKVWGGIDNVYKDRQRDFKVKSGLIENWTCKADKRVHRASSELWTQQTQGWRRQWIF